MNMHIFYEYISKMVYSTAGDCGHVTSASATTHVRRKCLLQTIDCFRCNLLLLLLQLAWLLLFGCHGNRTMTRCDWLDGWMTSEVACDWLKSPRVCKQQRKQHYGWRRGSAVRTSVCSRRTFPDLRLIHG